MVQLAQPFNSNDVEPSDGGDFKPMPTGWYAAQIEATEQKSTKDAIAGKNQDWYINFTFVIVGEHYANRKIFNILNLGNSSVKAKEIAFRDLSAICHATGKLLINDTSELHNIPHMIHVKEVPAVLNNDGSEKYKAKNEINGYKSMDDGAPLEQAQQSQSQPAQQSQAAAATKTPEVKPETKVKPPWE